MMKDLVVFDLDDTLVPEVLFLKSGIRHIASWLHQKYPLINSYRVINIMDAAVANRQNHYSALEKLLSEIVSNCCNPNMRDAIRNISMKEVVNEFRLHNPDPEIYHLSPSLRSLLHKLKNRKVGLAIITDGRSITQRNKIVAAGLLEFFSPENILISEETGHDKSLPDNFLALMQRYKNVHNFFYVADNPPKDFIHPLNLGWHTHLVHPFPLAIHQGLPI